MDLRKSQTKTLADLVGAALSVGRVSLVELGRLLVEELDTTTKSAIQRTWRFTSNPRVHVEEAMRGPLAWLFAQRRRWKNRPLLVSPDWTDFRGFHTLMAAAVSSLRALCSRLTRPAPAGCSCGIGRSRLEAQNKGVRAWNPFSAGTTQLARPKRANLHQNRIQVVGLLWAMKQGFVVLTNDLDFGAIPAGGCR